MQNQNMCQKAVNVCLFMLQLTPDCYKTQKMCEKAVEYVPEML